MSLSRRLAKPILVLCALVALAMALSACAVYKEGSLQVSQPGGLGPVRVHFELCTDPNPGGCAANEDEGQSQYLLMLRVPKGTIAPATITANPKAGGAPIVYSRNDEVGRAYEQVIRDYSAATTPDPAEWPPPGTETVGYLSAVFNEEKGITREWAADADFGLPGAGSGPFGGPFTLEMGTGWRSVNPGAPADRPVVCFNPIGGEPQDEEKDTYCLPNQEEPKSLGTSDLKIGTTLPPSPVFVGGKVAVPFPLLFGSTASPLPSFALTAGSTLPQAKLKVTNPTFAPGAPDGTTHVSPPDSRTVVLTAPKNAKPGVYEVTLTATAPQGGTTVGTAKVKVIKPKLKLGGVKLNKAKGTATLAVKVPSAGTLTVGGKDVVKAKKKAKKAKKLKITIRSKGKGKTQLQTTGKVKLKAKISFKPTSGIAVKKTKAVTLVLRP